MKQRILFISADVPWPPDAGGRIASLRVLEAMANQRKVDLVALADPLEPLDLSHLRSICERIEIVPHPFTFARHRRRQGAIALRSLFSTEPYRLRKFRSRTARQVVERFRAAGNYDLVHHEQLGAAVYHRDDLPSTLTTQNVESEIYRLASRFTRRIVGRAWASLESAKLGRAEAAVTKRFDCVFALSQCDADMLTRLGTERVRVLPIPVTAPDTAPEPDPPGPNLLTLGTMSWFGVEDGLLWFHEHVFPKIRVAVPDVRWHLVGAHPGPRIRSLAADPAISVHGHVGAIAPFVTNARVCLIPLHIAGGVRIKLLEFLANARPCVSTTVGARGIQIADGQGCFIRDDPMTFADAVVALMRDDELWRSTGRAGWEYVRQHHVPAAMKQALDAGIEAALLEHAGRGRSLR